MWGSFKVELDFFSKGDWTHAISGVRTQAVYGESFTGAGYEGAWIQEEFWRAFLNTAIVCFFTVLTSLTIATLGGYALSRSGFRYSFWLLIIALVFRRFTANNSWFQDIFLHFMRGMFGVYSHHHHCVSGNKSAIYLVDASLIFSNNSERA